MAGSHKASCMHVHMYIYMHVHVHVHTHTHTGIHECSVLNHGCDETLCLISNKLDGMCPCPASMIKQVEWDLISGQYRSTCTCEFSQPSLIHVHLTL